MPFWMKSAEHGVMPVYDMGEVERAKGHGWELINEGPSPLLRLNVAPVVVRQAPEQEKRKPGRPRKVV